MLLAWNFKFVELFGILCHFMALFPLYMIVNNKLIAFFWGGGVGVQTIVTEGTREKIATIFIAKCSLKLVIIQNL